MFSYSGGYIQVSLETFTLNFLQLTSVGQVPIGHNQYQAQENEAPRPARFELAGCLPSEFWSVRRDKG